jgi:insertion element IS1 protein InsB
MITHVLHCPHRDGTDVVRHGKTPHGWGAYERYIAPEQHAVGKQHTQKIESKHINLRARIKRLVRRTICFSKTERMHDLVIGLFVNRYEFGRAL